MRLEEFRKKRLDSAMERAGADILIATMPSNLFYLTGGYVSVMQAAVSHAECAAGYVPESGKVFYVAGYSEMPTIYEFAGDEAEAFASGGEFCFESAGREGDLFAERIMGCKEKAYETTAKAWAGALRASGKPGAVVAVDEGRIFPSLLEAVQKEAPEFRFVNGNTVFKEARKIKHPEEIEGIERAARTALDSLEAALSEFQTGMTEYELCWSYNRELVKRRALPCYGVVTAGLRAAYSDTVPDRKRRIGAGDMVRFDFGCMLDGYAADLARTAFVGEPDKKTAAYYHAVREGCRAAVQQMKPGALCRDIFGAALETVRKSGIPHYRRHHCGHGIGTEMYDLPGIRPESDEVLEEHMVLCVETPYYELGWGGVQVEHTVAMTETGCGYLDREEDGLILL